MHSVTLKIPFCAGHRILGHKGKCKHLHGHNYVAEVTFEQPGLDELGMVLDFGVIKEHIKGWIDKHWDHNLLLNSADPLWQLYISTGSSDFDFGSVFGGKSPYIFGNQNPTAEVMAKTLMLEGANQVPGLAEFVKVTIHEQDNASASYTIKTSRTFEN